MAEAPRREEMTAATRGLPPVRISEMESEQFRGNISGIAVEPDTLVARSRAGVPQKDLVRIP